MIVTIRGTSGSGKSTLARRIMRAYVTSDKFFLSGRKQPLYYRLRLEPPVDPDAPRHPPLRVLGHYESPTGGGDTISDGQDYIRDLVLAGHAAGDDVLYEGLVISSDFSRIAKMSLDGLPVTVIVLNTPLQVCLDSVAERRAERGNTTLLNPKTTTEKHRATVAMVPRFRAAGVNVHHVSRDEAWDVAREALRLP